MRIDQVVVGASPGDAVTEAAIRTRDALRRIGPADVYGVHVHPSLRGEVGHVLCDYPRAGSPADVVIYHVSIGEPGITDFMLRSPERLVLSYHNITPARFFEGTNPSFASRLRDGRAELAVLAEKAHAAVAVSEFNARELRGIGFDRVEVAAPPLNLRRLIGAHPDDSVLDGFGDPDEPLVLAVGQLLPHKRPDLAVDAHHLLNVNHLPGARLVVAGAMRQQVFSSGVVRHVESLRLPTVRVTGEVSDEQLAALYRRADVLVVPSEHEGFCVPLIEAMAFGVPVVARDFGAIRETAGAAALVLPSTAGSPELCEATARVLSDPLLRSELQRRGSVRAAHFSVDATLGRWLAALGRALRSGGRPRQRFAA